MKKTLLSLLACFIATGSFAQSTPYNPYTQNIHFSPEPNAIGIQNCGLIDAVFTIGLTTQDDALDWANNPMEIRICTYGLVLETGIPSQSVYGSYSRFFNWSMEGDSCLVGVQVDTLHGTGYDIFNVHPDATGIIGVKLIIPSDLAVPTTVGVNVDLVVPPYMDSFNVKSDDPESTSSQNYIGYTSISGTLSEDQSPGNYPDGSPIGSPGNTTMYVNVVNAASGLISNSTSVPSSGNYTVDSLAVNTSYVVQLSTNEGIKGQAPPPIQLPASWNFSDEDCCDSLFSDGQPNGELTAVQASTCPVEYANFGISNSTPLPADLINFEVTEINCQPIINWKSLSENNLSHYEIMRKVNGSNSYKLVEIVSAKSKEAGAKNYTYLDPVSQQENESYLYQLKMVDCDKNVGFSEIERINISCNKVIEEASLFPNPTNGFINLLYMNQEDNFSLNVEIIDVAGRKLMTEIRDVVSGQNNLEVNLSNLPKGNYVLKYNSQDFSSIGILQFVIN
jgi:hypothetical protein